MVNVDCPCCRRHVSAGLSRNSHGKYVCESCSTPDHVKPDVRDRTHLWLWHRAYEELESNAADAALKAKAAVDAQAAARKAEVDKLAKQNAELHRQIVGAYSDHMSEQLEATLKTEVLADADKKKETAYDHEAELLSILLLDIEPRHRGKRGPVSKCSCGQLTAECQEWQAIEPLRNQLAVWEKKQLARMREGKPFGLPMRHPEVKKHCSGLPRWEFKGLPSRVARLDRDVPKAERFT